MTKRFSSDGTPTPPHSNSTKGRLVWDSKFTQRYADVLGVKVSGIDLSTRLIWPTSGSQPRAEVASASLVFTE